MSRGLYQYLFQYNSYNAGKQSECFSINPGPHHSLLTISFTHMPQHVTKDSDHVYELNTRTLTGTLYMFCTQFDLYSTQF